MIKRYVTIILYSLFLLGTLSARRPSGPFENSLDGEMTLDEYSGPFKPETEKHDPQRYLTQYVYPFDEKEDAQRIIEINLEDTSLGEITAFIEDAFSIKFITDATVQGAPPSQGAGPDLDKIKVNFTTNKRLTKKDLWDLFITFTDIAGKMVSPGPEPKTYIIGSTVPDTGGAIRVPLPTYLGTNPAELPDNDMKIRYLYFVENSNVNTIAQVINAIRSAGAAKVEIFSEMNGILITEKASNIKAMMAIIKEIDRAAMPEAMSIIKLHRADATAVANLYTQLIGAPKGGGTPPYGRPRKAPSGSYFPPNMKVIPEARTNTLVLLGTPEAIKKVETFIKEHVDTEIEKPYSPLHTYYLKHADATTVANYLNALVAGQAGIDPIAAQFGGVRDGDKILAPMKFVPEVTNNMLLILGDYDDYLKVYELLQQIDIEQPQVIIRTMILTVDLNDAKQLGTQIRNKESVADCEPGRTELPSTRDILGKNTNFQFAGLRSIVTNSTGTGATRLLGDLIQLAVGNPVGTTAVTLGQDLFGIWGFLKILDAHTKVNVVDTPFLITTNKTKATIISGATRRVQESTIVAVNTQDSFSTMDANLQVDVTPLISSDGLIRLQIVVSDNEFTGDTTDPIARGNTITRVVNSEAIVFDKEVLAIGGIVRSRVLESYQRVPILGDIPIIGWLFRSQTQNITKDSLVILISPEIVKTHDDTHVNRFTAERLADVEETFCQIDHFYQQRDPGLRWFFGNHSYNEHAMVDAFLPGEPSAYSPEAKTIRDYKNEMEAGRLKDQTELFNKLSAKKDAPVSDETLPSDKSTVASTPPTPLDIKNSKSNEPLNNNTTTKETMRRRSKKKLTELLREEGGYDT